MEGRLPRRDDTPHQRECREGCFRMREQHEQKSQKPKLGSGVGAPWDSMSPLTSLTFAFLSNFQHPGLHSTQEMGVGRMRVPDRLSVVFPWCLAATE